MRDTRGLCRGRIEEEKAMKDQKATADRRSFLKLAGAGAVTGGAAVAVTGEAKAAGQKPAGEGQYRETEHVRRYYDSAR